MKRLKDTYANESAFTRHLCTLLEEEGAHVLTIVGGMQGQTPGIPDRYVSWRGGPPGGLWIESKRRGGTQSVHQRRLMIRMLECGCNCIVLDYDDERGKLFADLPIRESTKRRTVGELQLQQAAGPVIIAWLECLMTWVRSNGWEKQT